MKYDIYLTITSDSIECTPECPLIKIISDMGENCWIFKKKHFYGHFFEENMQKLKNLITAGIPAGKEF